MSQRVDPMTIEQATKRNGQVTVIRRIEVSKDGKTMTFVASGITGGGQKTPTIPGYTRK